MNQVTIYRRPAYRYSGVKAAAQALGVSRTAIHLFLTGHPETLGPEKRRRIVVKTCPSKGLGRVSTAR